MTNKGIFFIAAASSVALLFALNVLQVEIGEDLPEADTMAMAPISLGNPAAAATLQTRRPVPPRTAADVPAQPAIYNQHVEVGNGDTLAKLLLRAGVDRTDAHYAIKAMSEYVDPRRIRRGQDVTLTFESAPTSVDARTQNKSDTFIGFAIEPDYKTEVRIARAEDGNFRAEQRAKKLDRVPVRAEGTIDSSLYIAGRDAGVPPVIIARMIRLMSWDVDFQRDIRGGDSFEVMYERVFDKAGKPVYNGAVTFASITLSGKRINIYRHTLEDGTVDYFDENGKASRKALMRTPIDGARLSSTFGKRKHPILGYTRMHKGTDFAAPTGTPIYAAGNGTVAYAGRKGGYGNYIRIRHNGTYETAYAHMKGFARGVRAGTRVEQGQIIGYVGSTGRSTGPHLHYEVLTGGKQVNPLRVKMPSGRTLEGKELASFLAFREKQDRLLASLKGTELAASNND
ncbi:MAG: peptidoglycan DD-metalloendopeptidase family protein [Rhodospirillales bacterium]|nr:peptidoglycan DD-metalloendopeptidase family protein [Rhodospirillales bacterium]MBO6787504.1 peptidoglycan DD-metalloendopeptidase family protein [Rhodospirillales bacterium]